MIHTGSFPNTHLGVVSGRHRQLPFVAEARRIPFVRRQNAVQSRAHIPLMSLISIINLSSNPPLSNRVPALTPALVQTGRCGGVHQSACRGAIKTGKVRAIKTGIFRVASGFFLRDLVVGIETLIASAEDRALRGRNLSAVGSRINGQSGRRTVARLARRYPFQSDKSTFLLPCAP
jgi:hypothetical protein